MTFETINIPIKNLKRNTGQIPGVPKNPRVIKDNNFRKLKDSIVQDPEMLELREIIAYKQGDDYIIIGGNMRFEALKALNFEKAKCKVITGETTPEQLKRIILKDNSAYGEWDFDELANEWEESLLTACAIEIPTMDEPKLEDEVEEDEFDETKETIPARCSKGDIWQLGNHRLFVGDCTIEDNISRLMDGNRADITFTSPPYNMCSHNIQNIFKSEKIKKSYIQNGTYNEFSDALNDEQYSQLLIDALKNALKFSDDAFFNIGILQGSKNGIIEMLKAYQNNFCEILIWNKNNSLPIGMSSLHGAVSHRCELVFCFNQKGTRLFSHPQWDKHGTYKGSSVINRIDTSNASNNKYAKEHHATFPVEFAAEVLKLYTETSVLELFGGTGTTLIAAEKLNRRCFICELDPHYCDIIIARWEKLTGRQAVKLGNINEMPKTEAEETVKYE